MQAKLEQLKEEALKAIRGAKDKIQLEELENKLLGRKSGELTNLLKGLKDLSDEMKKTVGPLANEVKTAIENVLATKREEIITREWQSSLKNEDLDITQPALPRSETGHYNPNTLVQRDLDDFFTSLGFLVLDGP